MHWLHLAVAVIFEILVAIAAGKAEGFKNRKWTGITLASGAAATSLPQQGAADVRRRRSG
ncbi:hypothetical protein SGRI78S_04751 [Streptomyces griseus subsp. griseus]